MGLARQLREAVRRAAEAGDIQSPHNIEVEVNVRNDGARTAASAEQRTEILRNRRNREGRVDCRR